MSSWPISRTMFSELSIGMSNPVFYQPFASTSISIDSNFNSLQGIKRNSYLGQSNSYFMSGTTGSAVSPPGYGALYIGAIDDASTLAGSGSGVWYNFSVPSTWSPQETSVYGPDILTRGAGPGGIGDVALAGTWINPQGNLLGWYYEGGLSLLNADGKGSVVDGFQSFQAETRSGDLARYTYLHSVDGGFVVGNYSTSGGPLGLLINSGPGSGSFVLDPLTNRQVDIRYSDNARYHSVFGIWADDSGGYTITGGASYADSAFRNVGNHSKFSRAVLNRDGLSKDAALGFGMIADLDPVTGVASNVQHYSYGNGGSDVLTHFQGVYSLGDEVYQAPFVALDSSGDLKTGNAYIYRLSSGQFSKDAIWQTFEPIEDGEALISTSVAGNANTGVYSTLAPFASLGSNKSYFEFAKLLV